MDKMVNVFYQEGTNLSSLQTIKYLFGGMFFREER
jgi:hypothetical protein